MVGEGCAVRIVGVVDDKLLIGNGGLIDAIIVVYSERIRGAIDLVNIRCWTWSHDALDGVGGGFNAWVIFEFESLKIVKERDEGY